MLQFIDGGLEGLWVVHPHYSQDSRGEFVKPFERTAFRRAGIMLEPAEEFFSRSRCGTVRGLHVQRRHCQDKLVRVLRGAAYDVAVDLRGGSPTFGQWRAFRLTAENRTALYLPKGFAHGFLALEDDTLMSYLCGDSFDPDTDGGVRWDDPELGIHWPLDEVDTLFLSDKDRGLPLLAQFCEAYGSL